MTDEGQQESIKNAVEAETRSVKTEFFRLAAVTIVWTGTRACVAIVAVKYPWVAAAVGFYLAERYLSERGWWGGNEADQS